MNHRPSRFFRLATLAALAAFTLAPVAARADVTLTNVSYDPTREFYKDYNALFATYWKGKTGETVTVRTSNGGSGAQARSVIDGLNADVVTLGIATDIDAIAEKTHKIPANWQSRLPNDSAPYTSTVVFLVRKGNPKQLKDWPDLIKPGVQVITPNPKTSSGARWNFLAAYAYALKASNGDEGKAKAFIAALYKNVPVLDSGARGSTTTFVQRGQGDVLLAWENEAFLALNDLGRDKFEIVVPSYSVLAIPPVSVVDGNVDKNKSRPAAEAYLQYLYSPAGQKLIAHHYYRPFEAKYAEPADIERFPKLKLFKVGDVFGAWGGVQKKFFADGGVFDQIYGAGH